MSRPVALVTGALGGIGRAVALRLAKEGYDLGLADRAERAGDLMGELESLGARTLYLSFDLADIGAHSQALAGLEAVLGPVTLLVNVAGMGTLKRGDLLELSPESFDTVMGVNLRGTVFLSQNMANRMISRKSVHSRSIITITSVSAAMASPERADYCMSKAALSMFVQTLALRLAPDGIGVFEVRPGVIRTPMTEGVAAKYDKRIREGLVPAARWGEPEDVAAAVALLARGDCVFSTGSILNADGGLSIARL